MRNFLSQNKTNKTKLIKFVKEKTIKIYTKNYKT